MLVPTAAKAKISPMVDGGERLDLSDSFHDSSDKGSSKSKIQF